MLNEEQKIDFMNFVKGLMEDEAEFSVYSAFKEFRDEFGIHQNYAEVRPELRQLVKEAVEEVGGYSSEFTVDEDGNRYLLYYPEDWDKDEEEDSEYIDDDTIDEEDMCEMSTLPIDSKGRVRISSSDAKDCNLNNENTVFVNVYRTYTNEPKIVIAKYEKHDADSSREILSGNGFHVSVGSVFKDTYQVNAVYDKKNEEIRLIASCN